MVGKATLSGDAIHVVLSMRDKNGEVTLDEEAARRANEPKAADAKVPSAERREAPG